ncbi:MAG: response regulator transcription factor [Clostridiales bacterium]|jgi:DNA-binding response OmpR family regulator|nr:response regulator transcription factor [Clostridiales bacterium]
MYRVLIVDDEDAIRRGLREYAEFMGYEVDEAANGMEAVDKCRAEDFDLVVMDVMMPKLDGFTACQEIRKFKDTPFLMLTARAEEYDKLFGFALGIDDYVTKPFSPKEVMARIQVIIMRNIGRRAIRAGSVNEIYQFGGMIIDVTARSVALDGVKAELTPKEYDLLFYLVKNRNIALSREKLLSGVWGYDFYGDDRTVDTHIKTLRMALGRYKNHIVTLRGVGYKFEA